MTWLNDIPDGQLYARFSDCWYRCVFVFHIGRDLDAGPCDECIRAEFPQPEVPGVTSSVPEENRPNAQEAGK